MGDEEGQEMLGGETVQGWKMGEGGEIVRVDAARQKEENEGHG